NSHTPPFSQCCLWNNSLVFKRTNEYKALPPELIVSSSLEEKIRGYFLEIGITQVVDAIDVRAHVSGVAEKAEFVPLQWILGSDNDLAYFHACTG
ncbi:MAG: hypothetical protein VXX28_08325, partial [Verrucomicrobiota bacterium]|nr:hypothetical protein [Verrucomicrobiota bacterium]